MELAAAAVDVEMHTRLQEIEPMPSAVKERLVELANSDPTSRQHPAR